MDKNTLFSEALSAGIKEIEIYTEKVNTSEMSVFKGTIDDIKSSSTEVSYIRGAFLDHIGGIYVEDNNLSNEFIINTIKENALLITANEPYFIYAGDKEYPQLKIDSTDLNSISLAKKQEMLLKINDLIENYGGEIVASTHVGYRETSYETTIYNSKGLNVKKSGNMALIMAGAVSKRGDETRDGMEIKLIKNFSDIDPEEIANNACKEALDLLGGTPCLSGDYKMVIKGSVMRSLLQAFSSMFSAESLIHKSTKLEGKLNEKVFGSNITIIDDPLCPFAPTQEAFDDEGVASFSKNIVENGVFKTFLHNLKTASMFNQKTTANGYKASVSTGVGVSPSRMYLKAGDKSLDELFALCGDGIYLTDVAGLHAGINPVSGDFSLQSNGFLIKNGKVTEPINLIVASGNFIEMLNNVLELGNDLEFKFGNIAAPSVLVSKLSISGK